MPGRNENSQGTWAPLPVVGAAAVLLLIALESPRAPLFLVTDGVIAAAILAAAALTGLWAVALFRLGDLPLRWHLLLGAGLGVGLLASLVLVLGLAGLLGRTLWVVLLACGGVAGVVRLGRLARRSAGIAPSVPPARPRRPLTGGTSVKGGLKPAARCDRETSAGDMVTSPAPRGVGWLWLAAGPFAALALLVALVPPGLLWAEEGNGYDVLEYHLQMPREYLEAGRIEYAPHNVYANFPANAEMLYLLAMVVQGGPLAGVGVAKLINALLAFLAVGAAWLAGREHSPAAGVCTGLLAATAGWLTYLSGVAYVENAMLFFAMLSAAAIVRAGTVPCKTPLRWIILAGLLAGFSAGCKYTALVLIVPPLALAVLVGYWSAHRQRLAVFVVFILSAGAAFAPWALKNIAFTRNPVFPLAGEMFHAYPEGWSAELAEHFDRSHAPGADESSLGARVAVLWSKVLAEEAQRFGPAVFLLAVAGLVTNRNRRLDLQFGLVLLAQLGLWLGLTHLYARFAVVFLVPLVILGGRFVGDIKTPLRKVGLAVLLAGAVWNLTFMIGLYRRHLYADAGHVPVEGVLDIFTRGQAPYCEHLGVINDELPEDRKVLLVGEARAFYFLRDVDYYVVFNRHPFVAVIESAAPPSEVREWLNANGYTHVYVGWSEIERLRRSRYGCPEVVTHKLFADFVSAGVLRHIHVFSASTPSRPYAELYEVVPLSGEARP